MEEKKLTGYPSIDKPWLKYYQYTPDTIEYRDESMFQMLERCTQDRLDHVALELRTSANRFNKGICITYGQYIARIKECARALYAIGVRANETVVLVLPNIPESRILIYACNIIGATVYPVSPMISANLFEQILKENQVRTVALFCGFFEKFKNSIQVSSIEQIIYLNGLESMPYIVQKMAAMKSIICRRNPPSFSRKSGVMSWKELILHKDQHPDDITPFYSREHIAAIIGTSGTTGTSKGVCLTDLNLNAVAIGQIFSDHYREGDIVLDALIQSIGYGICTAHSTGCAKCHTILIPELIKDSFPEVLCKTRPDVFPGGPVHYVNLSRSKEFAEGKVPYVRGLYSGGATLEKSIEKKLNCVGAGYKEKPGDKICVRQGYGSTECCGAAAANTFGAYKFGSLGIPMVNVCAAVFKPGTDEELPYGVEGEICISGPTVMQCYLNNTNETAHVLRRHSDGKIWLHQADLGYIDEDGHLFMTDRIKNIFMRTGFNVHPAKITEFISQIPGVRECIVAGIPHPNEQMVPVAFVVLENGAYLSNEDAEKHIKAIVTDNLCETDIPKDWYFVDSLPRNMGGKIDVAKLVSESGVSYQ